MACLLTEAPASGPARLFKIHHQFPKLTPLCDTHVSYGARSIQSWAVSIVDAFGDLTYAKKVNSVGN